MVYGDLGIDKKKVLISSKHGMYYIIRVPFNHKGKQHEAVGQFV